MRRRVIHVLPKFSESAWGGAETGVVALAPHLQALGWDVEVWTSQLAQDPHSEGIRGILVRRFRIRSRRRLDNAGMGQAAVSVRMLWELARQRRTIALVHVHVHSRQAVAVGAVARALRIPWLLTIHSSYKRTEVPWHWLGNSASLRLASRVIAVADEVAAHVRAAFPSGAVDPVVIPNGVDIPLFQKGNPASGRSRLGVPEQVPLVLLLGRLSPNKRQADVVRAFARVVEQVPDAHLAVVGPPADPTYHAQILRERDTSAAAGQIVVSPGVLPNEGAVPDLYAAATLVLISSYEEAAQLVLLEAWAAARPVVSTPAGIASAPAVSDAVELIPHVDEHPHQLADALVRLLDQPERRRQLTEAGLRHVQHFSWATIGRQLDNLYAEISRNRKLTDHVGSAE